MRSTLAIAVSAILALAASLIPGVSAAADGDGGFPRNVAISPDGSLILTTSEQSNTISQVHAANPGVAQHIDVGAPTWGVCFLDDNTAVVTLPTEDHILVLTRPTNSTGFDDLGTTQSPVAGPSDGAFLACTEIIPSTAPNRVLVANRGRAPANAQEWQHAVYEVDIVSGLTTKTFVGEREPRSMVISSVGRLYVGYAQGALGQDGIINNTHFSGGGYTDKNLFDGGSILGFDMSSQQAVSRFAIGSPVRGLATWPPYGFDWQGTQIPIHHRIYFTSVGDGAQSEAPGVGGKAVPNVIGSILFDVTSTPLERQDTAVRHLPTHDPTSVTPSSDLPAVLPEKLALSWDFDSQTQLYDWHLWVTNSASGTATRVHIDDALGDIDTVTGGDIDLLTQGESFKVITGRSSAGHIRAIDITDANSSNATVSLSKIFNPMHIHLSAAASGDAMFASNPRGIAYDPVNDRVYAVTRFDHELLAMSAQAPSIASRTPLIEGANPIGNDQRNFFTFGRGFDFREPGADLVNNLSCGSCHVDGHIDGKVRFTVRQFDNDSDGVGGKTLPVAVPSIFDSGPTEWIFFEGLRTTVDRNGVVDSGVPGDLCNYCSGAQFFTNTPNFATTVSSPVSPFAEDGQLDSATAAGRAWFDAMNCSRCHAEGAPTFRRTNDADVIPALRNGPLADTSNLLSDPTQSFITNINATKIEPVGASLRNMTNVGTRNHETNLRVNGVNTPALAGAWDNRPYLHDGRYRTLEELLENTWVDADGLAAPIWESGFAPDNFANDPSNPVQGDVLPLTFPVEYAFQTHRGTLPGTEWTSVAEYLTPADKASLILFLQSLSSPVDPYPDATLTLDMDPVLPGNGPSKATVSWTTSVATISKLVVKNVDSGAVLTTIFTDLGTNHSETVTLDAFANWEATVTTSYGRQTASATETWDNTPQVVVSNVSTSTSPFCQVTVTWNTNVATSCNLDWGLYSASTLPNRVTTPAGTSHSVVLSVDPNTRYRGEIWVSYQPVAATTEWKLKYCVSMKGSEPLADAGILSATPNPFNPATEIAYQLNTAGMASLKIFDLRGRLVRTLVSQQMTAGQHSVIWKGKDDGGRSVASGVYFLHLQAQGVDSRQKLVLLE